MFRERELISAVLALVVALCAPAGLSQDVDEAPAIGDEKEPTLEELWRDLLHYISIARVDAALSSAQAILKADPKPADLYELAVKIPESMTVLARGTKLRGMKEPIASLRELIDAGYAAERTDRERIKRTIERLDKGLEGYGQAVRRLKEVHGEWAVPEMLRRVTDPSTSPSLNSQIVSALPHLGKDAVRPLSAALQSTDPVLRKIVAETLGRIEYPHAAARLKELLERDDLLDRTRKAAAKALLACGGKGTEQMSAATLFYQLAEKYYYRAESLLPDPRFEDANIWYWNEELGLINEPVPNEIFCDLYAMRMARLALRHNPELHAAVPLWISAGLDKQAVLPPGKVDPLRGRDDPPAEFYALASGPRYLNDVLERALRDFNTPVAMGALEALVRTIGAKQLPDPAGEGVGPLVAAMSYPDRKVRFFAAVSLAQTLPAEPFEGSKTVMSVLTGALRQTGGKVVVLIAVKLRDRNILKAALRDAGYIVADANNVAQAMASAQKFSGVDAVVLGPRPPARAIVRAFRNVPVYARMPFVMIQGSADLRRLAMDDDKIILIPPTPKEPLPKPEELKEKVEAAIGRGVGRPLTAEEATKWSVTAARTIRTLGLTDSKAFDISLAENALIEALGDKRTEVRLAAARALAVMPGPKAQRNIANLAISLQVRTSVRIDAFEALGESVRRYGNQLTDDHVKTIVGIVTGKSVMALREAAAELLGALNLPSQEIIPLIKSTSD